MKAQCGASIKIAYVLFSLQVQTTFSLVHVPAHRSPLFSSAQSTETVAHAEQSSFEDVVLNRRSAKSFQRFDGSDSSTGKPTASKSDPRVVQQALHCLDLARRTPTAYNSQPYKVVLVHSQEQKLALSRYCLGPNAARVLDSDCTAIFLADRQIFRTLSRYRQFVEAIRESTGRKPLQRKAVWQTYFYILLFSSGWPLPRFLAAPITFVVRTAFAFVNIFTRWFYPMPSLANAETWSSKQVMMVAMTYILGCTSLGLATLPMEGTFVNTTHL